MIQAAKSLMRRRREVMRLVAGLCLIAAIAVWPVRAVAAPNVTLTVIPQDDATQDAPSDVEARVITGAAPPPIEAISLIQNDAKSAPIEIKASELRTYAQGDERLGLVVLFEGQFV